jgi:hypothetical protein
MTQPCPVGQAFPQAPQCAVLVAVSAQVPLQRVVAPVQLVPQTPSEHTEPVAQAFPHMPQCAFEALSSTSHPLAALPSQSAKPRTQVYPQAPTAQVGVALGGVGHSSPQRPQ